MSKSKSPDFEEMTTEEIDEWVRSEQATQEDEAQDVDYEI